MVSRDSLIKKKEQAVRAAMIPTWELKKFDNIQDYLAYRIPRSIKQYNLIWDSGEWVAVSTDQRHPYSKKMKR